MFQKELKNNKLNSIIMEEKKMDRRSFLGVSSMIGLAGVVGGSALLSSCAGKKDKLVPLKTPGEYYVPELLD